MKRVDDKCFQEQFQQKYPQHQNKSIVCLGLPSSSEKLILLIDGIPAFYNQLVEKMNYSAHHERVTIAMEVLCEYICFFQIYVHCIYEISMEIKKANPGIVIRIDTITDV